MYTISIRNHIFSHQQYAAQICDRWAQDLEKSISATCQKIEWLPFWPVYKLGRPKYQQCSLFLKHQPKLHLVLIPNRAQLRVLSSSWESTNCMKIVTSSPQNLHHFCAPHFSWKSAATQPSNLSLKPQVSGSFTPSFYKTWTASSSGRNMYLSRLGLRYSLRSQNEIYGSRNPGCLLRMASPGNYS